MDTYNPKDIFIGVDGGASITRGVIFDINGNALAFIESKGSNLAIYQEKAADRICTIIENLITKANINRDLVRCIGLGIAGSSNNDGRDILFKGLDKAFSPFSAIILYSFT